MTLQTNNSTIVDFRKALSMLTEEFEYLVEQIKRYPVILTFANERFVFENRDDIQSAIDNINGAILQYEKKTIIYIVQGTIGDYEETRYWNVKGFFKREDAENFLEDLDCSNRRIESELIDLDLEEEFEWEQMEHEQYLIERKKFDTKIRNIINNHIDPFISQDEYQTYFEKPVYSIERLQVE